jgi:N-acetylmuramoyl-L-alanine amidase
VKLTWLLVSSFGAMLAALPASASEIVSWQFNRDNGQLDFSTDSRVQPEAQMLANPGKLVILLPETDFNRPTFRQSSSRGVREFRVGYDPETRTTSLVFELEPSYAIDPEKVLVKASSTNRWIVKLPEPQIVRGGVAAIGAIPVLSEDGRVITAEPKVTSTVVAGVSTSTSATISNPTITNPPVTNSPVTNSPVTTSSPNIVPVNPGNVPSILAAGNPVVVSAVELDKQYNRVVVRGSRQMVFRGGWDANTASYRINIENARLAGDLRLPSGAPVDLRVSQGGTFVQIELRRYDRYQIGPVAQYYGGQILTLPYGSAPRTVVTRNTSTTTTRPTTITTTAQAPTTTRSNGKFLVMIDPGHGGRDPGAIGLGGLQEVDVIMPIAKKLANILESKGIPTKMTRDSDYYVGLDERVALANRYDATIFVSIHANSIDGRPDVNGLETYYYGSEGSKLAEAVHRNVLSTVTAKGFYLGDRNTRSARFLVLRKSRVPAILVETGYLTNEAEVARLRRDDYRAVEAEGIAKGIMEYLSRY